MEILLVLLGLLGLGMVALPDFGRGDTDNTDDPEDPKFTQNGSFEAASGTVRGSDFNENFDLSGTAAGYGGRGYDSMTATDTAQAFGGKGKDTLAGEDASTLHGGQGADVLTATDSTVAYGGAGDDAMSIYDASHGFGDAGDDTLQAFGDAVTLDGGSGNDTLLGGILYGGEGDDDLDYFLSDGSTEAGRQDHLMYGGAGNDDIRATVENGPGIVLDGGEGNDTIYGDAQFDVYRSGADALSTIYGGNGDDYIEAGQMHAYGGDGNDTMFGMGAEQGGTHYGGNGNDVIGGDAGNYGGDGDDTISSYYGESYGDAGNDRIYALEGYGGAGNDVLRLNPFFGEGYMSGSEAYGGDGDDTLRGETGYNYEFNEELILSGGAGNDVVYSKGGEQVDAGTGNDTVFATTDGYAVTSDITLGEGADDMVMVMAPKETSYEPGTINVLDFNPAQDHLALIVAPSDLAALQVTFTPNVAGGNTVMTITLPGSTALDESVTTYDFKGITSLNGAAIKLYADQAAVLSGTSYGTLA